MIYIHTHASYSTSESREIKGGYTRVELNNPLKNTWHHFLWYFILLYHVIKLLHLLSILTNIVLVFIDTYTYLLCVIQFCAYTEETYIGFGLLIDTFIFHIYDDLGRKIVMQSRATQIPTYGWKERTLWTLDLMTQIQNLIDRMIMLWMKKI